MDYRVSNEDECDPEWLVGEDLKAVGPFAKNGKILYYWSKPTHVLQILSMLRFDIYMSSLVSMFIYYICKCNFCNFKLLIRSWQ